PAVAVAHGLTPERYEMQWDEIDELNKEFEKESKKGKPSFTILKGSECDIKPDGSLDLPDRILKKLDVVVASVHSRFNISEKEQTERILKALRSGFVTILGHPSGRLINEREPYAVDMERVIDACIKEGVTIEINSQPSRLDLFDYYCKLAGDKGAMFSIDSDSHAINQRDFLQFGIAVAKRGWVEKKSVINTLPLKELQKFIKKGRA
ncbi:MAG TPA: PHP domain-containing protein, partial [Candidatus Gracilibacteria bacterium]|nr:PHP domain-containing protein [Candidatus Gracilibacteria bacterium]